MGYYALQTLIILEEISPFTWSYTYEKKKWNASNMNEVMCKYRSFCCPESITSSLDLRLFIENDISPGPSDTLWPRSAYTPVLAEEHAMELFISLFCL